MNTVGQTSNGDRFSAGVAYVVLPSDVNRADYIQHCYRTGTVCCMTEKSEFLKRLPIDLDSLNRIEFPSENSKFGSGIVWVNIPYHNTPVVIAVICRKDQKPLNTEENQYIVSKSSQNGSVTMDMKADGKIGFGVFSNSTSTYDIVVSGKENAKFQVYSTADILLKALSNLKLETSSIFNVTISNKQNSELQAVLQYELGEGFNYIDEFNNSLTINNEGFELKRGEDEFISIKEGSIELGSGSSPLEPMVLGNKLKQIQENLLNAIQQITVPTALGPSGFPINASAFDQINQGLSNMISEITKTC